MLVHGMGLGFVKGKSLVVYILDGSSVDGQAIHHSDSRQVLNLDGGSDVVDDRAVVDDDGADGNDQLWLHGD